VTSAKPGGQEKKDIIMGVALCLARIPGTFYGWFLPQKEEMPVRK